MTRFPRLFMFSLLLAAAPVQAAGLPDTGQDLCYNGATMVPCTPANSGDGATYPGQDGALRARSGAAAGY